MRKIIFRSSFTVNKIKKNQKLTKMSSFLSVARVIIQQKYTKKQK